MADQPYVVQVTQVRPTIVSVDPADPAFISITRNEAVVQLSAAGPKEISTRFGGLEDINVDHKVDKSLVYYDGASDTFRADSVHTIITLTDGGNF